MELAVEDLQLSATPDGYRISLIRAIEMEALRLMQTIRSSRFAGGGMEARTVSLDPDTSINWQDLFHVKLAARRMLNHLELMFKFYGPVALHRPLRYADLNREEQDCIRKGPIQILPSRDKAGRLMIVFQGSLENVTQFQRVGQTCKAKNK